MGLPSLKKSLHKKLQIFKWRSCFLFNSLGYKPCIKTHAIAIWKGFKMRYHTSWYKVVSCQLRSGDQAKEKSHSSKRLIFHMKTYDCSNKLCTVGILTFSAFIRQVNQENPTKLTNRSFFTINSISQLCWPFRFAILKPSRGYWSQEARLAT